MPGVYDEGGLGLDAPLILSTDNGNGDDGDGDRPEEDSSSPEQQNHHRRRVDNGLLEPKMMETTRATKIFALCAALNSCNIGYDLGVNTGAVPLLQRTLNLSDVQTEIFVGSMNLFAMVGSFFSHNVSDGLGRRWAFRIASLSFVLGMILQSVATEYVSLMVGRTFVGLGVGFGLAVDPIYIGEISQARHRGYLVTWSEIGINVGIVLGFVSGLIFSGVDDDVAWRLMFSMGVIMPCLVIYCATFVMPESPRWLVSKGRKDEAREVLRMVYPPEESYADGVFVDTIVQEIQDGIEKESIAEHSSSGGGWNAVLFPTPAFRRMLFVGIGVAISQQAVGIDAIQNFLVYILDESGITSRSAQAGILVGLGTIKLGVIFLAGRLFDSVGRRPLFFVSLLGMSASLLVVSFGFLGSGDGEASSRSEGLAVFGLAMYMAFFSAGMGPGAWLVPSEVFSTLIRAKAMSVAAFLNRATATTISSTFLTVANAMSYFGFFLMMSVVCLVIFVWMYVYLPETKGVPLEEMSRYFAEITGDRIILEADEMLLRRNDDGGAGDGDGDGDNDDGPISTSSELDVNSTTAQSSGGIMA